MLHLLLLEKETIADKGKIPPVGGHDPQKRFFY